MEGVILLGDKDYPDALQKTKNPPIKLYYSGELACNGPCLAVVGSRNCSKKSGLLVSKIIKELPIEIVIVSGLAKGIDTIAHSSALSCGKKTIAVLPCGTERIYPKENTDLARKIVENGGLLVSEYEPIAKPTKFSFIRRNRIVAGISSAVLVIEAKIKSGTMTTVNFAKKQNKKIYAVPGSPGCDYLIKNGAISVSSPNDVYSAEIDRNIQK